MSRKAKTVKTISVLCIALVTVLGLATHTNAQIYTDLHNFDCSKEGCGPTQPDLLAQGRDGNLYGTLPTNGSFNMGTLFKATTAGGVLTIRNFNGTNGNFPAGGVTLGLDGNLYGTTKAGGAYDAGEIFRITPSGVLSVLHSFAVCCSEGANPQTAPTLAADGNFYGVTSTFVAAYKVSASGAFKVLTNNAIPGDPGPDPIIQATDGNFYGTTTTGGTFDQGTVFRMSPTGVTKVLFSFDETHGCQPQAGLIQGNDNNFYGTALCGKLGGGIVFKITPGGALTPLHNFDSAFPVNGQNPRAGLVLGTDGNLYGATSNGGTAGFGILFRMTKTGGGFTVLHNFDGTHGGNADATPVQHTDGRIYGLARIGGISATQSGVLYRLAVGLAPFVSLVNASGKVGTLVEILGNGFTGTSQVKFGSAPASFTVISNTYLTATVPPGAITGLVAVTTPSRTLVSNKIFRVIPQITAFSPTSGSVGTSVTITGVSLKQTTKVTFGGVKATSFTVNSNTKVTAIVPSGAVTGKIAITTLGGTAVSSGTFTVTLPSPLAITSGAPPSGTVGTLYFLHCLQIPPCNVFAAGYPLSAMGGVQPYSWTWNAQPGSSLPPGLTIGGGCLNTPPPTICGKPTTAGSYNVVVTVRDSESPAMQNSANYTIVINP